MALIVVEPGGRTHGAAVGYANVEKRLPLRLADQFHIGSINKVFTAVAVLRLVDSGRLRLDSTLVDLLGEAVANIPYSDRITVAQLLDHSSGIYPTNNDPDYLIEIIGSRADPRRVWSFAELAALADGRRQQPAHPPGEGHNYSDTNYHLLGMVVEKVTGRPFKEHVKDSILRPLAMRSTSFYSDELAASRHPPRRRLQGYLLETAEIREVMVINPMFRQVPGFPTGPGERLLNTTLAAERADAAGGMFSTLPDLARFARALFGGRLLSTRSQVFLMAAGTEIKQGENHTRTVQAMRKSWGTLLYKEGDGPGGATALMAYAQPSRRIYIGFTNRFGGSFDHVDFMIEEVVEPMEMEKR